VVSRREGLVFERRASAHAPGLFRVEKRIESRGVVERSVLTGSFWIFAAVTDETGSTGAFAGGRWLPLPHCRAFLIRVGVEAGHHPARQVLGLDAERSLELARR